ncbi:MAG: PorT family protein [Lewinellaceae bacterium]|jgi:hypothetical protein|nr:PorT family protein [Lewinellaceae bacterium]
MKNQSVAILFVMLFLGMASTGFSQVRFGVKAGLNLANISGDDVGDTKMLPTFLVGGQAEFGLAENLGLGVGLQLSGKGFKVSDDFLEEDLKYSVMYIQVPVLLQYRNSGFFAGVGPYVGFAISGKAKAGGESISLEFGNTEDDDLAPLDFGAGLELGYEFSNIRATASYNLGLANIVPKDIADAEDVSAKNTVIGIAVAYLFGGE